MLGQISCEIIALSQHLNENHGQKLNGELVDLGVKAEVIEKAGSWYSYKDERIGQGRENVKQYLEDHPEIAENIALEIKSSLGLIKELEQDNLIEDNEIDKTAKSSE